jgi:Amt family ammonium transporter
VVTLVLSGGMTLVIGRGINKAIGFRVSHEAETVGVDIAEHAESAYSFGELGSRFNPSGQITAAHGASQEATAPRAKEGSFA